MYPAIVGVGTLCNIMQETCADNHQNSTGSVDEAAYIVLSASGPFFISGVSQGVCEVGMEER